MQIDCNEACRLSFICVSVPQVLASRNKLPILKRLHNVQLFMWLSNKQLKLLLQQDPDLQPKSGQARLVVSVSGLPRSLVRPKEVQYAQGDTPTLHSVRQGYMVPCWAAQVS